MKSPPPKACRQCGTGYDCVVVHAIQRIHLASLSICLMIGVGAGSTAVGQVQDSAAVMLATFDMDVSICAMSMHLKWGRMMERSPDRQCTIQRRQSKKQWKICSPRLTLGSDRPQS